MHLQPPWSAHVTLTISEQHDAGRIAFDRSGEAHAGCLIHEVLRHLTFKKACIGQQLTFRVTWEPSPDGRYSMSVQQGTLVVTSYAMSGGKVRHSGPFDIESEDLQELRRTPSLREFLRKKGFNL